VRITVIHAPPTPVTPPAPPASSTPAPAPVSSSRPAEQAAPPARKESAPRPPRQSDYDEEDWGDEDDIALSPAELAEDATVGADALRELLKYMEINARVIAKPANSESDEAQHWTLEIQGRDLGALIGRRGETLAALQYITRLIASRDLERRANIVIDVEGYKSRREVMLRRLAKRMAEQAIQRGRTVSLEPMPPHERRIIHLTLRDNPNVTTESVGEGDHRKVTIVPRR
jgi:spoIIIJ-associated protein